MHQSAMKESYLENDHVKIWIEDGILFIEYKPKLVVNITVAKKIVEDRLKVSGQVMRPMFTDGRNFVSIDNASLAYLKSNEATQYVSAGAFFIDNVLQRLIGNIFITIDKPLIPAKLFTDKEKALQWLQLHKFIN